MKRFLIALLIVFPILAEAQHRVARIEVNSRVPARILLTQSALVEGQTYSTADLEVAVARLRRLPFVYDARYRLDGETLILDVEAMSRFFAELDAFSQSFESRTTGGGALGGGGRLFLGSGGVAEVTAQQQITELDDDRAIAAQYSQYGIGGTRFFATAGIRQDFVEASGVDVDPSLRLTVGYPLSLRSTITANFLTAGFERRRNFPLVAEPLVSAAEQRTINLLYTWDTTDDPFFARRGLVVSGGPAYSDEESRFSNIFFVGPDPGQVMIIRNTTEGSFTEIAAEAKKFWAFRERGTFFGVARASWGRREFDTTTLDGLPFQGDTDESNQSLAIGYGHNLFDWNAPLGTTRHRVEFTVGAARSSFDRNDDFFLPGSSTFDSKSATAAYVLRRQFATVRLNLSYTMD